jgi:8-oxo-dGTP pyrophosphatase MutT (NUDIX family)
MPRIRPLAICIFSHRGRILAAKGHDPIKQQHFYRPLGGGIEFGEPAVETLHRELREELGVEIKDLRYIGALENIFTFNGMIGHEIVLVYDGAFIDASLYEREQMEGREDADNLQFTVEWKRLDEFTDETPVYPDGLIDLLRSSSLPDI